MPPDVEVTVSGAEVTLSGTVDSRQARRRAEDIVEQVSGVSYVQNNIRVRTGGGEHHRSAPASVTGRRAGLPDHPLRCGQRAAAPAVLRRGRFVHGRGARLRADRLPVLSVKAKY